MASWLRLAFRVALQSSHGKGKRKRHGCVIVSGGRVLSHAANTGRATRHAEIRALKDRSKDFRGATLYSVRDGAGMSKPCPMCEKAIREAGIVKVVYYDRSGTIVSEMMV